MPLRPSLDPEDKIRKEIMNEYLRNHTEQTSEEITEVFHNTLPNTAPRRKLDFDHTLNEFYEMSGNAHSHIHPLRSYRDIFNRFCHLLYKYERLEEGPVPFPMSEEEISKKVLYDLTEILSHYKKDKDNFESTYKKIPEKIRKLGHQKEYRSLLRRLLNMNELSANQIPGQLKKPKVEPKKPFYEKREKEDLTEEAA